MWYKNILAKGIITFLLLTFFCLNINAQQVRISVNIPPPYPIHLEDYFSFDSRAVVTLTNMGNTTLNLKLITSVTDNQGIEGHVKDGWNPILPIILNPMEVKVLSGIQLQDHFSNLTENDASVSGIDINQIIRTETLPEGMYQVCVKALDVSNNQLLSNDSGCTHLFLTNYDPPIILSPSDEASVAKQTPQFVNFTWTPSGMAGISRYRLQLVDMTAVGLFNPNDAFEGQIQIQPFYEKENLIATTYPYSISDPQLEVNHQYAVRVTAYDPQGTLAFKNEGKSTVTTFTYKLPQIDFVDANDVDVVDANFPPNNQGGVNISNSPNNDDTPDPPNGACVSGTKYEGSFGAAKNTISNGTDILAGYFVVKNTVFTKNSGGSFNGTGTIKINFLNTTMEVEFAGIKVDNNNRLKSGKITGKVTSGNIINSQMATAKEGVMDNLPNAQGLYDKLQEGNRLVSQLSPDNAIDLPISWDSDKYNVGIVGLIFEPTEAYVNAILPIDVPQAMNGDWLNISTKGIKIHPNGFGDAEIKISLAGDKNLPLSNNVSLMVNGGNEETYVLLDCDGFHSLHIKGALVLSRKIALPLDNNYKVIANKNTKVQVPFEIDGSTNFENFFLPELTLSHPFSIPEAQDFVMEASSVSFDFSTSKNSNSFKSAFPNKGNDWIGLYMKSLKLTLPKSFKKEGGGVIKIDISDFRIDKMGVTGDFAAESAPLAKGSIAGWNFKLNKIDVEIENNKLKGGGLEGSVHIPLGKKANCGFTAIVEKGGKEGANYNFELIAGDEIEADLFFANIKLFEGSKIEMIKKNGKFEASTALNGEISIKFGKEVGKIPANSNVSEFDLPKLSFEALNITGKDEKNFIPEFDLSFFALESQEGIQANLGFFELGLDKLAFEKGANNTVGLTVGMSISLFGGEGDQSTGVSASTEFTLWAKYNKPQKTFAYSNAKLKKIELHGDIGVAYVGGKIDIYAEDPEFGNGFRGEAQIEVTGVNAGISVTVQFGRTLPTKGNYKYWYFDAMVKVPIPIPSTPATIYGFGGGAWCNMSRSGGISDGESIKPDQYTAKESEEDAAPTQSGVTFSPQKGKGGFSASVLFGITGSQTAFNADLNFSMYFDTKKLAVDSIVFRGTGYVMQSPDDEPRDEASSLIKINAYLNINVASREFSGNFGIELDVYKIVTGTGEISIRFQLPEKDGNGKIINQKGLKWHIKVGYWNLEDGMTEDGYDMFIDPNRLTAKIGFDKKVVKANLIFKGYLMAGNDLENGLPPLPYYIYNLVKDKGYTPTILPASSGNANNLAFAFGAGIKVDLGFEVKLPGTKVKAIFADFSVMGAFDVILANLNAKCDGEKIGFHGWYAKGQAFAYFKGVAGLFDIPIIQVQAGVVMDVELPNPTWVAGTVVIQGKNKEYSGSFEAGTRCNVQVKLDPFANAKLVKKIIPKSDEIEIDPTKPKLKVEFYYSNKPMQVLNPYTNLYETYGAGRSVKLLDENGEEVDYKLKHSVDYKYYTIIPKKELLPHSDYHLIVKAYIRKLGKNEHEIDENYDIKFTTAELPNAFNVADLVYSYPLHRQRFFMKNSFKGGSSHGVLQFKRDICYLLEETDDIEKPFIRIKDLKSKKEFDTPCSCKGQTILFDIPSGLKNETIYDLQMIAFYKEGGEGGGGGDSNGNVDESWSGRKKATKFKGLYFRTSKYNSIVEKLDHVKVKKVGYIPQYYSYGLYGYAVNDHVKTPVILLEVDESFEDYDVASYDNGALHGELVEPFPYSIYNGKQADWLRNVVYKHRDLTTLSNADKQFMNSVKEGQPSVDIINRPSGYPYEGESSKAFAYDKNKMYRWMKNYSYYEQYLKNHGYLNGGDALLRPRSPLSAAEINEAKNSGGGNINNLVLPGKNSGGGFNGQYGGQLFQSNTKTYFPIINFAPHVTSKDKLVNNIHIIKRAKIKGKFSKTVQVLNKLGIPTFPKGEYQFYIWYKEPTKLGNLDLDKKLYNYSVTEN